MPSGFASQYNALSFAYGISSSSGSSPSPLSVYTGNAAAGAATVNLAYGVTFTFDGRSFTPPNTNAPITIGSGTNAETVTPSAVTNNTPAVYGSCAVTATFANVHGNGDLVSSGTFGLQEAINYAASQGGGTVIVDAKWAAAGGTTAMITAATLPTAVVIEDLRNSQSAVVRYASGTIANAQVLTLNTVGVTLAPAGGSGTLNRVISCTLENVFLTAAFASGGVIGIQYGLAGTAASTTVAATFLTSPAANQTTILTGALASTLSSSVLNKALTLTCATGDFTTGAGSLKYRLSYTVDTGL